MMKKEILHELERIEDEHGVTILHACESGSRAWGFASPDSDYDVRFIYTHHRDWYLSILEGRDVIEEDITGDLDINGWDIKKALGLLRKSNPPLQEWLSSPIVYRNKPEAAGKLRDLARKAFLPESSCHHYLALARKSFQKVADQDLVRLKPFLYALRALLCCKWIIRYQNQPPMLIDSLLREFIPSGGLRDEIDALIAAKKSGNEKMLIAQPLRLRDYLAENLSAIPREIPKNPPRIKVEIFDHVFRELISRHTPH